VSFTPSRRRRCRRATLLAGLALISASCSAPIEDDGITTTTGLVSLSLSDLSGSWENERSVLRINDAGDYVVLGADADPDRPLTGGFVARDDENFIFVSGAAGECPGQTGVYGAAVDDDVLTLTLVDDPCASRATWFETRYSRA